MATCKLGLAFTASLPETVEAFNLAMDDYMVFSGEPVGHLLAAAEVDPDFAMGYCLTGCLRLFGGVSAAHPRVNLELRAARARRSRANPREQAHIDAFETAAQGELSRAGKLWDRILQEYPHDMMAAKCAHESYYLVGEAENMRDSTARILPNWDATVPYYGFLLGMAAFGHEECGEYGQAEELGRQAVDINAHDSWGVHAVAHVMQMQGRRREGIRWLEETLEGWRDSTWLRGHLWWHLCLQLVEDGQIDRVLDIYDARISDCDEDMVTRLMDCASLLWRLELRGIDIGDRWDALADKWLHHVDEHAIAFTDAHLAMTLAAAGRERTTRRFYESQHTYLEVADNTNADILRRVGQDLCRGLAAFQAGDYAAAADRMHPIRNDIRHIGGSNAQRDVFRETLTTALLKCGRHAEARDILEPLAKATPAPSLWDELADAYDGLGRAADADGARRRAAELAA